MYEFSVNGNVISADMCLLHVIVCTRGVQRPANSGLDKLYIWNKIRIISTFKIDPCTWQLIKIFNFLVFHRYPRTRVTKYQAACIWYHARRQCWIR